MSSNLYNKALKNIKLKDHADKVSCAEHEISDNLKKSFEHELQSLLKAVESKKLFPNKLYEFLIKYENNLPNAYFYTNLMKLGDILLKNSYVLVAKNQCFERYLIKIHNFNLMAIDRDIDDKLYAFVNINGDDELELKVQAIFGLCLTEFRSLELLDQRLSSRTHQQRCQFILTIYQKVMEIILKREKYCWLVYNGTICMYSICRRLIQCGLSALAIEPLTWASCCLETSVPLLSVTYLKWRMTIYSAVCEALFNIGSDTEAEMFARRGLLKINELHKLYEISKEGRSIESALIFCEATIKMGVLIFKRNAFETRRRPKSYLRPKTKVNFKEVLQTNWPRTGTERILAEMFESPSQQLLAILETVKQPSRTIGKIEAPAAENDWEILDVYSELFYAAMALIEGKPTMSGKANKGIVEELRIVDTDQNTTQLSLAVQGGKEITIEACFELICWAFSYGNFEFLDCIMDPFLAIVKDSKNFEKKIIVQNTLQLLSLMRKANNYSNFLDKKSVKVVDQTTDDKTKALETQNAQRSNSSTSKETKSSKSKKDNLISEDDKTKLESKSIRDPLFQLADFVEYILDDNLNPQEYYQEILIEAGNILWSKCKSLFQSNQDGSLSIKMSNQIPDIGKWLHILSAAHKVFSVTDFANNNPVVYSEVSLRLAMMLEQISIDKSCYTEAISNDISTEKYSLDTFVKSLRPERISNSERCITFARETLRTTIDKLNQSRSLESMNDDDVKDTELSRNFLDDLVLEMNSVFLRICARELIIYKCIMSTENVSLSEIKKSDFYTKTLRFCKKNLIFQGMFLAHLGNLLKNNLSFSDIQDLVKHIKVLLEKSENNLSNIKTGSKASEVNDNNERLPPPTVMKKGSNYITVRLDSDITSSIRAKIGWIRLYARPVDTPNAEVRLTDDKISGAGIESSCLSSEFSIYNLIPNEQYILAFSAFDKFGFPIGRGIGHSTKYILASNSINRLYAMSIIAQVLFEIDVKEEVVDYGNVLWDHFIDRLPECTETYQKSVQPRSIIHNEYRIKEDIKKNSSPMFLRQFCLLMLSSVDCECRVRNITNDILTKSVSQIQDQVIRLRLSDKLLALFSVSKKLKDHVLTMEIFASISCLMVPIMNHNQFYQPFSEILMVCINILHGLPQTTWIKIPGTLKGHLHHLIGCIGFYLLKSTSKFQSENDVSESVKQSVTLLLQMSGDSPFTISDQDDPINASSVASCAEETNNKVLGNVSKKALSKSSKNDGFQLNFSPQQMAFEIFKFSSVKQNLADHPLLGNEEPNILMSYIANLPSRLAYKEVSKFARKTRYFQFIVEILHKSVIEGNLEQSLNYYKEIREWLRKRNELVLGRPIVAVQNITNRETIMTKFLNAPILSDKDMSSRSLKIDEDAEDGKKQQKLKRKTKYKAINVRPNMSDVQKHNQEQAELKALEVLSTTFYSMFKLIQKRRKFRQISEYERMSRVRMNCSMAMSYLGMAFGKIDTLVQLLNGGCQFSEVPELEDITKFLLDGTGKILSLEEIGMLEENITVLKTTKQQSTRKTDTPRTFRSDMNISDKRIINEAPKLLNQFTECMGKVALLLQRAIILSHRSKNWVLLSTACSLSWFSLALFINNCCRLTKFISLAKKECLEVDWSQIQTINLTNVFKVFSPLCYFGSEAMMDMMENYNDKRTESTSKHFDETFFERFVLRSVHLLFESQKYEKTIHVILRFSRLTNFIFINSTHPILIESQKNLCLKAQQNHEKNPNWTEEMCQQYMKQCLSHLNCDSMDSNNYHEFLLKRSQGKVNIMKFGQPKTKAVQIIKPQHNEESHVQNLFTILKSETEMMLFFSVPIDHDISLKEWNRYQNESSPKKLWTELCYKRNYFNFRQSPFSNEYKNTQGMSFQDLINIYKGYQENAVLKNSAEYYPLVLRDFGDIFVNNSLRPNIALSLWNEGLDHIFNKKNSINSIKNILETESQHYIKYTYEAEKLVSKFGVENCLLIAELLTRISRYENSTCDQRLTKCLQAATFYKSIYSTSFCHPENDMAYLDHLITLDPVNTVPLLVKTYLFSNSFFLDVQDIESNLYFIINYLIQNGYFQFTISLLALYEHIVYTVCKSPLKCIQAQIMKLELCIRLKRFSAASRLIFQLFSGDMLPQLLDSRPAPSISKPISLVYNDNKHIKDDNNLMVIDKIVSRRINSEFSQKIGLSLSNKISLLQSEFLMELSSSIPASPEVINPKSYNDNVDGSLSAKKQISKRSDLSAQKPEEDHHSALDNLSSSFKLASWKEISLALLKGLMLQVSGNIVQSIIEEFILSIQKEDLSYLKMSLDEVERVLLGLLVQAKNCRLRQCSRSGARLAMFGLKFLQEYFANSCHGDSKTARIFRQFNVVFHMKYNAEMADCLLNETSIGNILGPSETAVSDVPSVKNLIMTSISECDESGLHQQKAWFLAALAQYALISGYETEKYKEIIQESIEILKNESWLCDESENLLIECESKVINLQLTINDSPSLETLDLLEIQLRHLFEGILRHTDKRYSKSVFWNIVDQDLSQIQIMNLYDDKYNYFAKMKLLHATIVMKKSRFTDRKNDDRLKALSILNIGLDVVRSISLREPWIETEFLLMIGRIQRYLLSSAMVSPSSVISALIEGLKLSLLSSGHLGIKKQFFLELALTFINCSGLSVDSFEDDGEIISISKLVINTQNAQGLQNKKISKADALNYRKLSWLCIQCANQVSVSLQNLNILKSDTSCLLSEEARDNLPVSVLFDLFGRYKLGTRRVIFKNEIEEELSRMPESKVPRDSEHLEDQIERIKNSISQISLSQILAYQELVLKLSNNQFLSKSKNGGSRIKCLTRSIFCSSLLFQKESEINKYLLQCVTEYKGKCSVSIPQEILKLSDPNLIEIVEQIVPGNLNKVCWNTGSVKENTEESHNKIILSLDYPEGILLSNVNVEKMNFDNILGNETEVLFQFYDPPFEFGLQSKNRTILFYACTKKVPKSVNKLESIITGWLLLPSQEISQTYRDIQESAQLLEVLSANNELSKNSKPSEGSRKSVSMSGQISVPSKSSKSTIQQFNMPPGSEISAIELKVRQVFDRIASWSETKAPEFTFSPAQDLIIKNSENSFIISSPGATINSIPFDLTKETVRTISNALNPILSSPITGSLPIVKFVQDILKIEF